MAYRIFVYLIDHSLYPFVLKIYGYFQLLSSNYVCYSLVLTNSLHLKLAICLTTWSWIDCTIIIVLKIYSQKHNNMYLHIYRVG